LSIRTRIPFQVLADLPEHVLMIYEDLIEEMDEEASRG